MDLNFGRKLFAFVIFAGLLYVCSPLILPLAMGALLATLIWPLQKKLQTKRFPKWAASLLLTFGLILLVVLPTVALIFVAVKTGLHQVELWRETPKAIGTSAFSSLMAYPKVHSLLESVTNLYPVEMDELVNSVQDAARSVGLKFAEVLGGFFSVLPGIILSIVVSMVSVYFFLVDGPKVTAYFRRHSPFSEGDTQRFMVALEGICRSVILASLISGVAQALIETISCASTGTSSAALIGFMVLLGSFIPVVGSAPVTITVAIRAFLMDRPGAGIVLLISAVLVVFVDNLIRPWFLRGSANLHPLLAFVSAIGGLAMFGFTGVFIGPIIAAMALVILEIMTGDRAGFN
jgi:predicted PurR-regulated permease PerM